MVWAFSCCNNLKLSNLKVSHPQNRIQLEIIQVIPELLLLLLFKSNSTLLNAKNTERLQLNELHFQPCFMFNFMM